MTLKLSLVLVATIAYATIRYNYFGPVSVENIPVYILNKAIAFASAGYLLLAAWNAFKQCGEKVAYWGKISYYMVIVHVVLSVSIFNPLYFGKFFYENDKMNVWGEMLILTGALAMFTYYYIPKALGNLTHLKALHIFSAFFMALHAFFLGARGWLKPEGWHGGLPPITMLSFILAVSSFVLFSIAKHKKKAETA